MRTSTRQPRAIAPPHAACLDGQAAAAWSALSFLSLALVVVLVLVRLSGGS